MRMRGAFAAMATLLLLTGMFVAVHRGGRGRELNERIAALQSRSAAAEVQSSELGRQIEVLRSRSHIVRVAEELGLHMPSEEEFVILDLSRWISRSSEGSL